MELNLENFNIRNSKPIILGNAGLPKNTERYHLNGMDIIGIDIYKDDKIKIINIEGSQICEITFFDKNGKCISLTSKTFNNEANFIKNKIKEKNYINFLEKLKKKKFDLSNLKSLNIFNEDSLSNDSINLSIENDGFAIFAAPG